MANETLPTNISLDVVQREYNRTTENPQGEKKNDGFNEKNYLDTRLGNGEKTKELTIRLLPISATDPNPFMHVHFHNVEVPKEMVENGKKPFKSYICLNPIKNPSIDHNTFGNQCPFCEENHRSYEETLKISDPDERKEMVKYSLSYKAKEAIIVRCIDRDHEEDGVKFWKFNLKFDKSDPYHKILSIVEKRRIESLKATGKEANILDLNNGRDFTITITEGNTNNQTSINVVESGFDTPLSKDPQQAIEWISDKKTWQDVFTVKPYEYLKLILDGKYPWFDRTLNKWVDKAEFETRKSNNIEQINQDIKQVETGYMYATNPPQAEEKPEVVYQQQEISDEDLPF